jgi:hypothetical protein
LSGDGHKNCDQWPVFHEWFKAEYDEGSIMPATVRLNDIVDALEGQFDGFSSYLDLDTGQVDTLHTELLSAAEEGEDPDLLDWEKDEWELAKRIASSERFLALPSKFDVHEWGIMESFTYSIESSRVREDLLNSIHGSKAFQRFKDTVHRHNIETDWFAFRLEALKQIAIEWCEGTQIFFSASSSNAT